MKTITFYLVITILMISSSAICQPREVRDDANGDWTEQHVTLFDTPEAGIMVRSGDIDNLGFGWPDGFDPFSGNNTPNHYFPWDPDSTDVSGTDRIMVVSSYNGSPPHGQDGYTGYTSRPENLPRPIVLNYGLGDIQVESAMLQIFVDDFQAPIFGADYFVSINGVDASYFSDIVNSLIQTGPIGKIVNVVIPEDYLYLLESDSLSILFDDTITGAGDGYAIDFVKLLINVKGFSYTSKMYGYVTNINTGEPLENATVSASGTGEVFTDQDGFYFFNELPAGISSISVTKFSYDTASVIVDLVSGDSIRKDFQLNEILDAEFTADQPVASEVPHSVQFTDLTSMNPTSWSWNFGDGTTSEDQNPSHTYEEAGYYTVTLTASNDTETNTEVKIDYIQVGVEGIEEFSIISDVLVRPNPLSSKGTVSFILKDAAYIQIDIFDLTGKVVKTIYAQHLNQGEFEVNFTTNDLTEGLYLIVLNAGSKISSKKIFVLND